MNRINIFQCMSSTRLADKPLLLLLLLLQVDWGSVKWGTYLNILFWNLNVSSAVVWDCSCSTAAG
jgi:hypothetical protein